jgi:hypothetical protein
MGWSKGWNLGPGWLSPTDRNLGTWVGHGLEQGLELGSRLALGC